MKAVPNAPMEVAKVMAPAEIRAWAQQQGLAVGDRGRIPPAIRQAFEDPTERAIDRHVAAVATLTCNWTMNCARDLAWNNSLLLWTLRNEDYAQRLFMGGLATATEMASRLLLVAV